MLFNAKIMPFVIKGKSQNWLSLGEIQALVLISTQYVLYYTLISLNTLEPDTNILKKRNGSKYFYRFSWKYYLLHTHCHRQHEEININSPQYDSQDCKGDYTGQGLPFHLKIILRDFIGCKNGCKRPNCYKHKL